MAISNYTELQAAITDWMDRSDLTGNAADFVTLAEARLNRELGNVRTTASLTATIDSAQVSISSLSMIEPGDLWITDSQEYRLTPRALGTFAVSTDSGLPSFWALEGSYIKFDRPCDEAYSLRFTYEGRYALSDAAPTNDLLTYNPDIYLTACQVWGNLYVREDGETAKNEALLQKFVAEHKSIIAQQKRGQLTVDPALSTIGRRNYVNEIDLL